MRFIILLISILVAGCGPAAIGGAGFAAGYLSKKKGDKKYQIVNNEGDTTIIFSLPPIGSNVEITLRNSTEVIEGIIVSYTEESLTLRDGNSFIEVRFNEVLFIRVTSYPDRYNYDDYYD